MRKTFIHLSRAWYGEAALKGRDFVDEIAVQVLEDDVLVGEFHIRWETIDWRSTPCLHAFDDSWAALAACPELVKLLGDIDGEDMPPAELTRYLLSLGYADATKETA